jgi:ligand-binding sensor domain-containing protein/signal transduction histidine kinase
MTFFANDAALPLALRRIRQRLVFSASKRVRDFLLISVIVALVANVLAIGGEIAPETLWRLQEGSPSKTITAVIQSKQGYVWVGTYDGLVRYDGVSYTLVSAPNLAEWHDDGVTSLYEEPDGTLWIGHARGGVSAMKAGVFEYHPPPSSGRFEKIQSLATDERGDTWALDSSGRLRRVRDDYEITPLGPNPGDLLGLTRAADGHLWLTSGGHLYSLENDALRLESNAGSTDPLRAVQAAVASRDGGLWIVADRVLWNWKPGSGREQVTRLALPFTAISAILEARDGRLFISTAESGMEILTPGPSPQQSIFARSTNWVSDCVLCLGEDREGGVWLGTGGAGLFKLHETRVRSLAPPDVWQGRAVLTTCPAGDGGFWVGTEGAGLYRLFPDGTWKKPSLEGSLQNPYIWALYQESGGPLWIGSWAGLDVLQNDRVTPAPGSADLPSPIFTIAPARDGGLWIGGRKGVAYYRHGKIRWLEPEGKRMLIQVHAIVEQTDGVLWVSSDGEGLARVQDGHIKRFLRRDGLATDYLNGLLLEEDGTVWVGSRNGGLMRVKDDKVAVIGTANGLAHATISHLMDDGLGFLWMSSQAGLLRVSKRELNDCADGRIQEVHCLNYRQADGLKSLVSSSSQQAPNCTTADGSLVFCSDQELQLVDPKKVRLNTFLPPVVIEEVRVAGVKVTGSGPITQPLRVGPGAGRIDISYTGLSFAEPQLVRFKYRLEGLDSEWVQAGTERHAAYNAVPPGSYVFRVSAANNDNLWNPVGNSVGVIVLPHFWQTLWFRLTASILVVLAAGATVWLQTRARMMRKLERVRLEHAIESERTRIASDMHDDLGGHLTHIALLSDSARSSLDDREKVREGLNRIYEVVRKITRATDEIVWAISPRHDTLESLINYCEKFAQELLASSGIRCEFDFPAEIPDLSPRSELRHNVFLAYKEALNNAVKHSGASLVSITLVIDDRGGRLTVADNGHGITDTSGLEPSSTGRIATGNGLSNMRQRMAQVGGECEIASAPGQGCTVVLMFPWSRPTR